MKSQNDAVALKMLNSVTETMLVAGPYIPDAELDLWDRPVACAYAAQPQSKEPAMCKQGKQVEVHLEAIEMVDAGKASVSFNVSTPEKKDANATEAG